MFCSTVLQCSLRFCHQTFSFYSVHQQLYSSRLLPASHFAVSTIAGYLVFLEIIVDSVSYAQVSQLSALLSSLCNVTNSLFCVLVSSHSHWISFLFFPQNKKDNPKLNHNLKFYQGTLSSCPDGNLSFKFKTLNTKARVLDDTN